MNFCSDNVVGASETVLNALVEANKGAVDSYGADALTDKVNDQLKEIFECDLVAFPVATGSAANSLALSAITPPWGAIYTHPFSHAEQDECGAPEFYTGGAKITLIDGPDGKIDPALLDARLKESGKGVVHHVQPASISLTQITELGARYEPDEVAKLAEIAKSYEMAVHMDGARFANAVVGQNSQLSPADITWRAGVDVLSFGATKNGAMAAEAVVFFNKDLAEDFHFRRKRGGHLFSKMRFLSAQLTAYLDNDHWLDNAGWANSQARMLSEGLGDLPGVSLLHPVDGNEMFVAMQPSLAGALRNKGFKFYDWVEPAPEGLQSYRLVTAHNTDTDAVDLLLKTAKQAA